MSTSDVSSASSSLEIPALGEDERTYATYLLRKSGVDFQKFRHADLTEKLSSLISPLDHAIAFAVGAIPGFLLSMGLWFFYFGEAEPNLRAVMFFVAVFFGVVFGTALGVIAVLFRTFRELMSVVDLGVVAARSVKDESRHLAPSALSRLSKTDIMTGATWIVFLPVMEAVVRRRLKVRAVGGTVNKGLRRLVKRVVPLRVPADADEQIAKLPPVTRKEFIAPDLSQHAFVAGPVGAVDVDAPLGDVELLTRDEEERAQRDWVNYLEDSRPKVLAVTRGIRRALLIPLTLLALGLLIIMVGGAALTAHVAIG